MASPELKTTNPATTTAVVDPVTAAREARDRQLRTVLPIACVLMVTLRLFIGWQFLYEGLWKLDKRNSANPWTAEGYLANAQGPLRHTFRAMVGDPTGLDRLNYGVVAGEWDDYRHRFLAHYDLTDEQKQQLDLLIDGADTFVAPVGKLPREAAKVFDPKNRDGKARAIREIVKYDGENFVVKGDEPLLPSEIAWLKGLVLLDRDDDGYYYRAARSDNEEIRRETDPRKVGASTEEIKFFKALERLEVLQSRNLGYKRQLRATIGGDPDRLGVYGAAQKKDDAIVRYVPEMGTLNREQAAAEEAVILRYGEQQIYRDLVNEYEDLLEQTDLQFPEDHAAALIGKVRAKRAEVIGPVEQLDRDLKTDAQNLLTSDQFAAGSLPPAKTPLSQASDAAMWGLLILGTLLLLGFCTPLAALAGAVMLLNFYLVWPPWPGVPDAPGPEHSYIVDKNLIEVVALLAIAAMPTGRWFGLDGVFAWLYRKVTTRTAV